MTKKVKRRSYCPIGFALDIFGDRWSLLIIRDLMFKGKRTYGEFLNSEEKISTNILADRLARLEASGLITSEKDVINKSRYLYSFTEMGVDLVPVMIEIVRWSADHDPKTGAPKEFVDRVKNDRENVVSEITDRLNWLS